MLLNIRHKALFYNNN